MRRLIVPLLTSALVASACAGNVPRFGETAAPRSVQVVVQNHGVDEIVVELARSGIRIPLGTVRARETRSFTLNPALLGSGRDMALEASDCVGRSHQRSPGFDADPGDRVEWAVETRVNRSALTVR